VTTTTPSASAVADLADRLAVAAGVHAIVTIDPDQGDNACAYLDPCTGAARIDIGATDSNDAMAGTLAHEFAHHQLGHVGRGRTWRTIHRWAAYALVGSMLAAMYVPALTWLALQVMWIELAVFVLSMLVGTARERAGEYAADAQAIRLLNGLGIDGRAATIASLREPADPWWHRVTWPVDTHPTTAARLRRIAAQ
jgi:Zn-dependent protease with chaperone function